MSTFTKVAKNTLAQIFGRAGVILTTIFLTALLTRLLGVEGYGNYTFIIALVMFFVSMADWGTGLIFVREAVKEELNAKKFYGNAFFFRFALSLVSLIVMNLAVSFWLSLDRDLLLTLRFSSLLLVLISLKTSCHIVFQTKQKFEYMALTDVSISLFFLLALLFTLSYSPTTINLALVIFLFLVANFLGVFLALYWTSRLANFDFTPDKRIMNKIVFETLPTGALLLVFSIYNRLDIFLLQAIKGAEPVGLYGLAYRIHDNLILGSAYLATALFPLLSSIAASKDQQDILKRVYKKSFDILFLFGFLVLVSVLIFAPLVISIVGGPGFGQSITVLRILAFATLIAYFNHLTGYTLIALGKQKVSLIVAIVALFWNLGLNLLLIPQYSYLAAAFVTIATEGLVLVLTSVYLARRYSLYPSLTFYKTLAEIVKTKGKIF